MREELQKREVHQERIPLRAAQRIAERLVAALAPHFERMAIAGSIRRGRQMVGDIDLVAIPHLKTPGLFGETEAPRDCRLVDELCRRATQVEACGDKIVRVQLAGLIELPSPADRIGVDLYLATPETWATLLLIRTGSKEHNIWLCTRAQQIGARLHADGSGLDLPGQYDPVAQRTVNMKRVTPRDEADIFAVLTAPPHAAAVPEPPCWRNELGGIPAGLRECNARGVPIWLNPEKETK